MWSWASHLVSRGASQFLGILYPIHDSHMDAAVTLGHLKQSLCLSEQDPLLITLRRVFSAQRWGLHSLFTHKPDHLTGHRAHAGIPTWPALLELNRNSGKHWEGKRVVKATPQCVTI